MQVHGGINLWNEKNIYILLNKWRLLRKIQLEVDARKYLSLSNEFYKHVL